jgi:hypothetical protein
MIPKIILLGVLPKAGLTSMEIEGEFVDAAIDNVRSLPQVVSEVALMQRDQAGEIQKQNKILNSLKVNIYYRVHNIDPGPYTVHSRGSHRRIGTTGQGRASGVFAFSSHFSCRQKYTEETPVIFNISKGRGISLCSLPNAKTVKASYL